MLYSFDDFVLDTDRFVLSRDGRKIALRPKVFDLLAYLAERPRQIAGKDEILDRLWPDVQVEESSLTQCISNLRRALGSDAEHLIKTVPRRGYVLDADVRLEPEARGKAGAARIAALLGLTFAVGLGAGTFLPDMPAPEPLLPGIVLDTSSTVLGQPIRFPAGDAHIIAGIKTLPPGARSPEHRHETPLFAYVLEGEIELEYRGNGSQTFRGGDAMIEAIDVLHTARNNGAQEARILVVEMRATPPDGTTVSRAD